MLEYDKKKLGLILRDARINVGLSQREVSIRVGYSSSQFISNIERGVSVASLKLLAQLVRLYKIRPEVIANVILDSQKQLLRKNFRASNL